MKVIVKPGLEVTGDMHDKVTKALTKHTKCRIMTWEEFISKNNWMLVSDLRGFGYKAEYVIKRDNDNETVKANIWFGPDVRDGEENRPHNHSWDFSSYILDGGYDELRWVKKNGKIVRTRHSHRAGSTNVLKWTEYHEVVKLHKKPTLTLMVTKGINRSRPRWGYLDLQTGEHISHKDSLRGTPPSFKILTRKLNP